MIKAILYDLDGVLVEAVKIHFDAFNMALKEVASTIIEKHEEEDFNGLPTKKKLLKLTELGRVKQEDHDLIWQKKQDYTKISIRNNLRADPIKIELHQYTKSLGIISVCVTNSITDTARLMLECSGQWEFMDFLISNQMARNNKPNSEPYIMAMVSLQAMPSECIIVEDSDVGYTSAINTGAHVFRVKDESEVTKESVQEFIRSLNI